MSKTILVTGANTGIGYALCKLLATEHGCSVLLGSRTKSKGEHCSMRCVEASILVAEIRDGTEECAVGLVYKWEAQLCTQTRPQPRAPLAGKYVCAVV